MIEKSADEIYRRAQKVRFSEKKVAKSEIHEYADAWKDGSIPELQLSVSDFQLDQFRNGIIDPVFESLISILKYLQDQKIKLLDLACATGYYSEIIGSLFPNVMYTGADYSESMIVVAGERYPDKEFFVEDATSLSLQTDSFDCVMLSGALEHIPDYQKAIREICRVSKKYIILHRLPIAVNNELIHTLGSQYSIITPRTYFSEKYIERQFVHLGFCLRANIPTYPRKQSLLSLLRLIVTELKGKKEHNLRDTRTLLFEHKEASSYKRR